MSNAAVAVDERAVRASDLDARILDGALLCLARFGVAKTTLDDIAREAGCSRATVYRYFPNRSAVVEATVQREIDGVSERITTSAAAADTLEDAVTAMFVTAAKAIVTCRRHIDRTGMDRCCRECWSCCRRGY